MQSISNLFLKLDETILIHGTFHLRSLDHAEMNIMLVYFYFNVLAFTNLLQSLV